MTGVDWPDVRRLELLPFGFSEAHYGTVMAGTLELISASLGGSSNDWPRCRRFCPECIDPERSALVYQFSQLKTVTVLNSLDYSLTHEVI